MIRANFKILIVEDEVLVAMDIKEMLTRLGYQVIGLADRLSSALSLFTQHEPDLLLCDVKIKGERTGIEVVSELRLLQKPFDVIYLTAYSDETTLLHAFSTGPKSYLMKPFTEIQLEVAVNQAFHQWSNGLNRLDECPFTERELEILLCLEQGLPSKVIATRLSINPDTVKTHRRNMLTKIGVENSLKLINTAIAKGWIRKN
jgi:DNA-binding NarL/FixJ family response regulator